MSTAAEKLLECKRDYPGLCNTEYYFITEHGRIDMTYAEYLFNKSMRMLVRDPDRYRLVVGRRIYSYDTKYLKDNPKVANALKALELEYKKNPLQFFMPNGEEALSFLNDDKSSVKMLVAGNRFGKTTHGIIDMILDIIPCDPNWKIFTENGVKYRPWKGVPQQWGVASYSWRHITMTIAPLLLQWIPDEFLGEYAINTANNKRKVVNAEKRPFIELTNGSSAQFFCYTQETSNYESAALAGWLWDEQGYEDKFDGADERTRTLNGRHIFPLTPHRIKGRPDTGAGTWIHGLWKGETTKGHRVGRYMACTFDNPDWIYSEKEKRKAFIKWVVEPSKHHDNKTLAEGESRLYGEFHESAGLVYDELVRDVHIIDSFDLPSHWTRYRGLDHGHKNPTACIMGAVAPNGDIFLYDEYYATNKTIYENVNNIILQCGNARQFTGKRSDFGGNTEFNEFEEVMQSQEFEWTALDGRSYAFTDPNTKRIYGDMYESAGMLCKAAPGGDAKIDIVKEFLRIDYDRDHFVTKTKGAPTVYIFRECKMLIQELFSYVWVEQKETVTGTAKPKPKKKNDHAVNAMEYLLTSGPEYLGDILQEDLNKFYGGVRRSDLGLEEDENYDYKPTNSITGY
jgi:hypothetical protein